LGLHTGLNLLEHKSSMKKLEVKESKVDLRAMEEELKQAKLFLNESSAHDVFNFDTIDRNFLPHTYQAFSGSNSPQSSKTKRNTQSKFYLGQISPEQ